MEVKGKQLAWCMWAEFLGKLENKEYLCPSSDQKLKVDYGGLGTGSWQQKNCIHSRATSLHKAETGVWQRPLSIPGDFCNSGNSYLLHIAGSIHPWDSARSGNTRFIGSSLSWMQKERKFWASSLCRGFKSGVRHCLFLGGTMCRYFSGGLDIPRKRVGEMLTQRYQKAQIQTLTFYNFK